MKITVWSALSGKISGHLIMNVPATHTVRKLLDTYCSNKGVTSHGYVMRSRDNLLLNPNKSLEQSHINDGETLTLSISDDEEQTFAFGSWWTVTVAAFLIGSVGLATACWAFLLPVSAPIKYGIVMDAGSSHSEIYVFSWNGEKPLDTANVMLVHSCFMEGGVNSFVDHVDDLSGYLEGCIKETKEHVPTSSYMGTPFYVEATAGMRILRDFDSEGAQLILATLREMLRTMTSFLIAHDNVEIMEGSEEGASGWMAVNYLLGHLERDAEPTAAALDVGGASMQISRVVIDNGTWAPENLTLFRHSYTVLSQSFLCYGVGEAQHRYDYFLVNEKETLSNEVFIDPCLAKGISHNITTGDLSGPCTRTDESRPLLSGFSKVKWHKLRNVLNYKASEIGQDNDDMMSSSITPEVSSASVDETSNNIITQGSSNASLCDRKIRELFDLDLCKKTFTYGDCMNAKSVPGISGDLVAFSGLFKQLIMLLDLKPGSSLLEFKNAIFEVCSLNGKDLYKRFPDLSKDLVEDFCFDAMYIYNLMTVGLGIDSSEWKKIQFTDKIDNTEVDWPLGFMMNRTTPFPADIPPKPMGVSVFILLLLLFAAFLLSGTLFCWHSVKIKKQSTSYQSTLNTSNCVMVGPFKPSTRMKDGYPCQLLIITNKETAFTHKFIGISKVVHVIQWKCKFLCITVGVDFVT